MAGKIIVSSSIRMPIKRIPMPNMLGATSRIPGARRPMSVGFTDVGRNEIWPKYPHRSFWHKALPASAIVGISAYMGFRAWTVAEVGMHSAASLPIACALYGAELHAAVNSLGYQMDTINEGLYQKQKEENWPSVDRIKKTLGPSGERTMIEIASAGEDPITVRATMEGTLEIEGNKQPVWCSQANIGRPGSTKEETYQGKARLVEEINREYQAVWDFISEAVNNGSERQVNTADWQLNEEELRDRTGLEGRWKAMSITEKREALRSIFRMLSRRYITRGGMYVWSGSETEDIPNESAMTEMMRRLFTGELKDCGEVPEVGLARETDVSQLGCYDAEGNFISYEDNPHVLARKVREAMMTVGANQREVQLYGFAHLRDLIRQDKNETMEESGGDLPYFPKNVRRGGEDIKIGLEYEARAGEVDAWDPEELDEEFAHIANIYTNHRMAWWDRDRFADQEWGGKKASSMNSLLLHAGGRWFKVQRSGTDFNAKDNFGYTVAQDTYSALMRVILETFENGQSIWSEISPHLSDLRGKVVAEGQSERLMLRLADELSKCRTSPRRFIIYSELIKKLEGKGRITEETLEQTMREEGWIDGQTRPSRWSMNSYAKRIRRAHSTGDKMKELRMFFDENNRRLVYTPSSSNLAQMAATAIRDTVIPEGYEVTERYDFSNIRFFANLDAEVNPRPEFLEQTIPYFLNLIASCAEKGERRPTILQTPQFYVIDPNRSDEVQIIAMKDQRLFYQKIQPSKSVNHAAFSCGSNVVYDLDPMREISDVEFNDPIKAAAARKKNAPQTPGGPSQKFVAEEIFRSDHSGAQRPIITFIPSDTPVEDFEYSFLAMAHKRYWTAFQDRILCKGEAPKDIFNLLGNQHPKWGATIATFLYEIVPAFLRGMPGATYVARSMVKASRVAGVRHAIGAVKKLGNGVNDLIEKNIQFTKRELEEQKMKDGNIAYRALLNIENFLFDSMMGSLYRALLYRPIRYAGIMINEASMGTKPSLNLFSKEGFEFLRAGIWYLRGPRDLILCATPSMTISAYLLEQLGIGRSDIFLDVFTPMVTNILVTLGFVGLGIGTSMGSYLHGLNRLGQKPWDVMVRKESTLLTQGWPGYLFASYWSLLGPSGRPGNITDKGALGRKPLPLRYDIAAKSMTAFNIATTAGGAYLAGDGLNSLGWDVYMQVGGGGMLALTFWSGYHAFMGVNGAILGRGGPKVAPRNVPGRLIKSGFPMDLYQGENISGLQHGNPPVPGIVLAR